MCGEQAVTQIPTPPFFSVHQLLRDAPVFFAYLDRYLVTAIMEHPARLAGSILPKKEVWNNATTAEEKNIKGPSESPSGA